MPFQTEQTPEPLNLNKTPEPQKPMICTEQTPEPLNLNDSTTQTSTATWDGPRTGERPQLLNRIQLAKWRRENHVAARADLNLNVEEEAGDCHSGDHGLDPEHTQVVQLKLQCT